jgi:hypothetical protein
VIDNQQRAAEVLARLGRLLDDIDEQSRRPGEKPLRKAVAEQARERIAEMRTEE